MQPIRIGSLPRTIFVRRGLGQSLNKQKNTPDPQQRFGWFFVFVGTKALLAPLPIYLCTFIEAVMLAIAIKAISFFKLIKVFSYALIRNGK